jgi:hypothetical protein
MRLAIKIEDEIDDLYRLPLVDFTNARNALAGRLKKEGRADDAERVKLLAKPSVSAWAVNQLYWNHRDEFDELIAAGKRFRPAASRKAGKMADMRQSLDARREVLSQLESLAADLLRDAGHSPTLDTLRRINVTLEALSAYALLSDGPAPGRLAQDVDPPSFASLASLMSGVGATAPDIQPARSKSGAAASKAREKPAADLRQIRQAKIAAAKVSLQDAKRSLVDARAKVQSVEAAQKKAAAEVKQAEKQRREVAALLEQASAAVEDATRRSQAVAADASEAAHALEDAKHSVDDATKELESLLANRK